MKFQAVIDELENGSVRADLGFASTRYALLQRLEANSTLRQVRDWLIESPEDVALLLERAVALYESTAPAGYAHPDDLALSAYLFLLSRVPRSGVQRFISRVVSEARAEFFAATSLAKYFASRVPSTAGPANQEKLWVPVPGAPGVGPGARHLWPVSSAVLSAEPHAEPLPVAQIR